MAETDKFNPHNFAQLACDSDYFRKQLPPAVKEVMGMRQLKLGSDFTDEVNVITRQLHLGTEALWNQGSGLLQWNIYRQFAKEHGWLDDKGLPPVAKLLPKKTKGLRVLSATQRGEWGEYLSKGEISRPVALDAFARSILPLLWLPPIKFRDPIETRNHPNADPDPDRVAANMVITNLCNKLAKVPYIMILDNFLDLTDQDVRVLFGRINTLSTVEDIRRRAKG